MRIYIAHPYTGAEERNRKLALDAEETVKGTEEKATEEENIGA